VQAESESRHELSDIQSQAFKGVQKDRMEAKTEIMKAENAVRIDREKWRLEAHIGIVEEASSKGKVVFRLAQGAEVM